MILVTSDRTATLECTEASQTFSDKPEENLPFYADLYNLAVNNCSPSVNAQMEKANAIFVDSVYQFLLAAKVLSYA